MKFHTIAAATALSAASVVSAGLISFSPIPGYPWGNGFCLTDQQANFLVNQFKSVLTNPDRNAANATATVLVTEDYVEESDSINILAGFPLGGPSFSGRTGFVQGVAGAPAIPGMSTLEVFHDCNRISWRWLVQGLGLSKYEVKGINDMYVPNVFTGQISRDYLEFNSIAWGIDTGYSVQTPTGQSL